MKKKKTLEKSFISRKNICLPKYLEKIVNYQAKVYVTHLFSLLFEHVNRLISIHSRHNETHLPVTLVMNKGV